MVDSQIVSLPQAVERLARDGMHLSYYTLKRLVDEGQIPCQKIGRKYVIYYENILTFLRGVPHVKGRQETDQQVLGIRRIDPHSR